MPKINSYDKGSQDWDVVVTKKRPDKNNNRVSGNGVEGSGNGVGNSLVRGDARLADCEDVELAPRIAIDLRLQIQRARVSKGLSQKELANRMSVPAVIIQNYENGKAMPTGKFLANIERILGCKFDRPTKKSGKKSGKQR